MQRGVRSGRVGRYEVWGAGSQRAGALWDHKQQWAMASRGTAIRDTAGRGIVGRGIVGRCTVGDIGPWWAMASGGMASRGMASGDMAGNNGPWRATLSHGG